MLHVIATIELRPGRRDDFLTEFRRLVPEVRAEAGCLDYGPAVDARTDLPGQPPPREDVVTVVERWEDLDHLKRHLVAPHVQAYRQRVADLIVAVNLLILEPA